jgi:mycothiol maleylpyruvate isomerase-like protein
MQSPIPAAVAIAYSGITDVVADLDDMDLLLPSGCRGWSIADLLLHVTLDAQRALVALATPADEPADVDFVSYWRGFPGDPEAALAHGQWVRRSAAAYQRPSGIVGHWTETSAAAARAAAEAGPARRVATQGHVLTVPDFLITLVTEAVIHHLDAIVSLPDAAGPSPEPVALALATLRGLAAPEGVPARWSEREALLKGTGRAELDAADRRALGDRAAAFPLLG